MNINVDLQVTIRQITDIGEDTATTIQCKLDKVLSILQLLVKKGKEIVADLTELQQQVQENTQVEASAITLLNGLAQQIADLKDDPQALQALSDQLKSSGDALAAAIAANTPAQPQ